MLHFYGVRPRTPHKPSLFHEMLINNFFFSTNECESKAVFSRFSSQKESREFSATIFYSTAFCSVDNEEILHEVLHESVCYL